MSAETYRFYDNCKPIFDDLQYFTVSNRIYVLSNNVGIHFVFTYYFLTGSQKKQEEKRTSSELLIPE